MTATQQPDPFGSDAVHVSGPSGPRAGFWIRFVASFIDGLILGVPFLVIDVAIGPAVAYAVYIIGAIAYFTMMEGGPTGQTIGKRAVGIRVIDFGGGGPIGYGRAAMRLFGRIISELIFFLGYLWMLWDKEKQTWHDKIANAVVVPTSSYPVV
jgi:uncharacterized RDD family membrane protein YckC